MNALLLDTNTYAAFLAGDESIVEALQAVERILVSVVVIGELLAGFEAGAQNSRNRRELSLFLASPRVSTAQLTPATAEFYSAVYGGLRRKSRPIPTNDMWIAAGAFEHGVPLLTRDDHFRHVDGLLVASGADDLLP
jgi:tRNA(fMet)-specific endonuclease VapC